MTDPQVRQLAEQWLASRGLADLSLYWPTNKPIPQIDYESGRAKPDLIDLLAAFASHTRREALREAASLTCGCCAIDGDPEDWINKSTATPAGDDGGPRFVHVYPDGTTIECGTQEIWAAIRLLAEEKK